MHQVHDFKQLCFMYLAGAGEFHFYNRITQMQYNLKFRPIANQPNHSYTFMCFTRHGIAPFYYNIGKYDFKYDIIYYKSLQVIGQESLNRFLKSFTFINEAIHLAIPLPEKILVYYAGNCCRCGKHLTTQESLTRGFGELCCGANKDAMPAYQTPLL